MNTVSKALPGQMLIIGSAANADRLSEARPVESRGIEAGGWNAYDVWRRCIKEARDRRKSQPGYPPA